jgi:excisionase family DNA binding protein
VSAPLLTTRQVAEQLGLSPATVLRRWRAGEIPGYRLASNCLRFDAGEIDAWLADRRFDGIAHAETHRPPQRTTD